MLINTSFFNPEAPRVYAVANSQIQMLIHWEDPKLLVALYQHVVENKKLDPSIESDLRKEGYEDLLSDSHKKIVYDLCLEHKTNIESLIDKLKADSEKATSQENNIAESSSGPSNKM